MSELLIYIIIAIIWGIVSLIQKAVKPNKNVKGKKKTNTSKNNKPYTKKTTTYNNKNTEEEIFRELKKNMESLKNYSEETLNENKKVQNVYTSNYETSNSDREILELQEKYNSKISQINSIKNDTDNNFDVVDNKINKKYVNNMLTSLDIKNAIIYNAILEPKRINYRIIKNREVNKVN
ncbi:hypothetical protein [Brachyspira alvinipulli]|uniref:hypothetical protein n=1 Tax=Brachyspira alvinipulli TaxID=84379 RepID=UPI000481AEA2|nr:hypothetical protein [Brachyspira alvinipulli]